MKILISPEHFYFLWIADSVAHHVLHGPDEVRRVELRRIVLLSSQRMPEDDRIDSGEVGHRRRVELVSDEDWTGTKLGFQPRVKI